MTFLKKIIAFFRPEENWDIASISNKIFNDFKLLLPEEMDNVQAIYAIDSFEYSESGVNHYIKAFESGEFPDKINSGTMTDDLVAVYLIQRPESILYTIIVNPYEPYDAKRILYFKKMDSKPSNIDLEKVWPSFEK